MTTDASPIPHEGQLREEAASWWSIMHGPEAEGRRAEFEAWLNRGSYHRNTYNRIAETHAIGKHLKDDPDFAAPLPPVPARRSSSKRLIPIALFASGLLAGAWSYREISARESLPAVVDASGSQQPFARSPAQLLSTRIGEVRPINLEDGTLLILDTDSLARVSYDAELRTVSLERGRARIRVAQDARPFKLSSGSASVVTSVGQFDVDRTKSGTTKIIMINGTAQVTATDSEVVSPTLVPGQALTVPSIAGASQTTATEPASNWPSGSIDVDNMMLSDLVLQANRYSTSPIVVSDSGIGNLRISGHFKITDTTSLADRLAALFNLSVERASTGALILRRK